MHSREATRIRSSGVYLSFCPGTLKNAPHEEIRPRGLWPSRSRLVLALSAVRSGCSSREPGRSQTCAKADGSAAAASVPAKFRALRSEEHTSELQSRFD